jgi:hypothetical protein
MQLQIDASGSRESITLILSRNFGMTHVNVQSLTDAAVAGRSRV